MGNTIFTKKFDFGKFDFEKKDILNKLSIAFGKKDLNKKLAKILKKMGKTPEQIQNFKYYLKV